MIKYLVYDTETISDNYNTDDINIHDHKPFMVSYIAVDEKFNILHQDYFHFGDTFKESIFKHYLKDAPTLVGANIKFDVHMLLNHGYSDSYFKDKNYIDVQVLARLVINHDKQTDKSFRTALKQLAVKATAIRMNPDYISVKKMKEIYGFAFPCINEYCA